MQRWNISLVKATEIRQSITTHIHLHPHLAELRPSKQAINTCGAAIGSVRQHNTCVVMWVGRIMSFFTSDCCPSRRSLSLCAVNTMCLCMQRPYRLEPGTFTLHFICGSVWEFSIFLCSELPDFHTFALKCRIFFPLFKEIFLFSARQIKLCVLARDCL